MIHSDSYKLIETNEQLAPKSSVLDWLLPAVISMLVTDVGDEMSC